MYNQLISFIEQRATSQTACGGQLPYQGSLANCGLRAYIYMHNVITIVPGGRPTWRPYGYMHDVYTIVPGGRPTWAPLRKRPANCGSYVYAA